jgi:hypothetical protein
MFSIAARWALLGRFGLTTVERGTNGTYRTYRNYGNMFGAARPKPIYEAALLAPRFWLLAPKLIAFRATSGG